MSGCESTDLVTAAAQELAKQLPVKDVYNDALKPAAGEIGQFGLDLVKTLRLALAPLQYFAAYQDRLRNFLDRAVREIPEDRRRPPPPQILGPVIEGIRYEDEGTPVDEMFRKLLSSSMDSEKLIDAHPSFPHLIRQLSADEARILVLLNGLDYAHVSTADVRDRPTTLTWIVETDDLPRKELRFPSNVPFYMEHLDKLGLAGVYELAQNPIMDGPPPLPGMPPSQSGIRRRAVYKLTDFGRRFMKACS